MNDKEIVKYTGATEWTSEDEKNKFIESHEKINQEFEEIISKSSTITNGNVILDNIAKDYQNKILSLDSELTKQGHSIFDKDGVLFDV